MQQRKTLSTLADLLQKSWHHVRLVHERGLAPRRFGEVVQETSGAYSVNQQCLLTYVCAPRHLPPPPQGAQHKVVRNWHCM
jgi:hypothetical protein